jgi:hypothetical protein
MEKRLKIKIIQTNLIQKREKWTRKVRTSGQTKPRDPRQKKGVENSDQLTIV